MYRSCNTEESAIRQQHLEEQLFRTMLQKPYSEISVSDLCEQAGISRKSFYRYFGNKDGCLSAMLDRMLLNSVQPEKFMDYKAGAESPELVATMHYWKTQKPILDLILSNHLESKLLERCYLHVINEDRDILKWLGVQDLSKDSEAVVFTITGFVAVILDWSRTGFQKSLEEMAQVISHLMTDPLMSKLADA